MYKNQNVMTRVKYVLSQTLGLYIRVYKLIYINRKLAKDDNIICI